MYRVELESPWELAPWREQALKALSNHIAPDQIIWNIKGQGTDLFDSVGRPLPPLAGDFQPPNVPRSFVHLADGMLRHSDPDRFGLAYGLLWRQTQGEKALMADRADPQMRKAQTLAHNVRKDAYYMKAHLRFRKAGDRLVAWYDPDHFVVDLVAPEFIKRMGNLDWAILTPKGSALYQDGALGMGPACDQSGWPQDDEAESWWKTYYTHVFNPARLKVDAMMRQMPKRYWHAMPETQLIPQMIRQAALRTQDMIHGPIPPEAVKGRVKWQRPDADPANAQDLKAMLDHCRFCPLWENATQAVAGTGPLDAKIMVVGEQPGDEEDLKGQPFIGPAGRLLRQCMEEAGMDLGQAYVTNAVKHFKFDLNGKRRIHRSPNQTEISACNHWLQHEIAMVQPKLILALGASAARAILGKPVKIQDLLGQTIQFGQERVIVTWHPSAALRHPLGHMGQSIRQQIVDDIERARLVVSE